MTMWGTTQAADVLAREVRKLGMVGHVIEHGMAVQVRHHGWLVNVWLPHAGTGNEYLWTTRHGRQGERSDDHRVVADRQVNPRLVAQHVLDTLTQDAAI